MLNFFTKLWIVVKGWFGMAGDDLARSNPAAVYDASIRDKIDRYHKLMDAVAGLASQRERLKKQLEDLQREEADLELKMEGALSRAESDPAHAAEHEAAYNRFSARKQEVDEQESLLEPQLIQLAKDVENYKLELKKMQADIEGLRREKDRVLAEKELYDNLTRVQSQLAELSQDSTDQMLTTVRQHTAKLKEKAKVGQELSGISHKTDDAQYAQKGREAAGSNAFQKMLAERKAAREAATKAPAERNLG